MDDKANRDKRLGGENQGEGDYKSARVYNEHQKQFNESGKIEKAAKDAEKAIEGKEGDELRRAEEAGKSRSHGEDPQLKKVKH
jgi:hypothetical protein